MSTQPNTQAPAAAAASSATTAASVSARTGGSASPAAGAGKSDDSGARRVGDRRQPGNRRRSGRNSDEHIAGRLRIAQYGATVRGLPLTLGGTLVLATMIAALSPGLVDNAVLLGWLVSLATLTLLGMRAWWRWRAVATTMRVSRIHIRLLAGLAGVAGALWACVPVLMYLRAGAATQQLIAPLLVGMLGIGIFTLAALPQAVLAFAGALSLGTVGALAAASGTTHLYTLLGWLIFAAVGTSRAMVHARDLHDVVAAEARNDEQQQLIGLLLRDFEDKGSDVIWELDTRGRLVQPSRSLGDALGMSRKDLDGKPLRELLAQLQRGLPDTDRDSADGLTQRLTEGQPFRDLMLPLMLGGQPRWWSVTAKPLVDERGAAEGWRGVARDVTQSRVADKRLSWLAHYDTLTGLINRAQFRILLEQAMTGRADDRDSARGTVLCLDLDNFKTVNDTLGHATGDALLTEVAKRIKAAVGKIDLVARLGGDEFAVLLRHVADEQEIHAAAARIADSMRPPCEAHGANVTVRTSIGVARFPQDGSSVDEVMQHADLALYEAKSQAGGAMRFFEPSMGEQVRRRLVLERDLRTAIEGNQLVLHYQPKVDVASWRVTGFEALLRWEHPEHGPIPPSEFVPVAEDSGLILALGEWVLNQACREAMAWPRDLQLCVNISAVQVMAQNLPAMVTSALKASQLAPRRLELEITESVFINENPGTVERLHALRKLGVSIALDDFGTGYSSLAYLRRFPFDTLKIDRAFIRELLISRDARSIVRNILAMARSMRMTTVAEGVEEPAQIKALDAEGCTAVQGYYIAKAMPASAVDRFLIDWREDRKPVSRRSRSSAGTGARGETGKSSAAAGRAADAAAPDTKAIPALALAPAAAPVTATVTETGPAAAAGLRPLAATGARAGKASTSRDRAAA
ncbi:MAG: hypothetical protein RLZZ584_2555 [Pseudomonadota bacterium]